MSTVKWLCEEVDEITNEVDKEGNTDEDADSADVK